MLLVNNDSSTLMMNMYQQKKIHGSNVSIIVDNQNNIEVAKRTALLTEQERLQKPWNTLAQFATEQKELIISWVNKVRKINRKIW